MPTVRDYVCLWGKTGSELRAVKAARMTLNGLGDLDEGPYEVYPSANCLTRKLAQILWSAVVL